MIKHCFCKNVACCRLQLFAQVTNGLRQLSVINVEAVRASSMARFLGNVCSAGAITRLPAALGQRGAIKDQKYNYVVQKVTNVHQEKIMNMIIVNEAHAPDVYEKIEVLHNFRFAAGRVNIFPINFNFTHNVLGKLCCNMA